jgi:hypothetical protein
MYGIGFDDGRRHCDVLARAQLGTDTPKVLFVSHFEANLEALRPKAFT